MLDGTAKSLAKVVRLTTNLHRSGPSWPLNTHLLKKSSYAFTSYSSLLLTHKTLTVWCHVSSLFEAKIISSPFGLTFWFRNEPHDLPDGTALWAQSVQAAVTAIRQAGATSQIILIPGSSYSSAQALPTEAGPDLLTVTDPAGGVGKLVFDGIHT